MKKIFTLPVIASLALCGCGQGGGKTETGGREQQPAILTDAAQWESVYRKIEPKEIQDNPFELIGDQWMLITSGDAAAYNTMTASWGGLGVVWSKPVAMITVRNVRYTNEFLERNERFTLSFFDETYRDALTLLGTKSGRDGDKVAEAGLTPVATPAGSMSFGEARMVIECAKIYVAPIDHSAAAPFVAAIYADAPGEHHNLYIGEITAVWVK